MRTFLMLACIVISVASVGCCGPLGCGPGCDVPVGCNECDNFGSGRAYFGSRIYNGGCGVAGCRCGIGPVCGSRGVRRACGGPGIARASIDRVRQRQPIQQLKRTLVCGSGCGETYLGEWISSPPDSCDPCRGDTWNVASWPLWRTLRRTLLRWSSSSCNVRMWCSILRRMWR